MVDVRMRAAAAWDRLAGLPVPGRLALVGAVAAGVIGAVVGLVVGLLVYPPTAWFAVVEIGLPSALVGAVLGLVIGSVTQATRVRRG